jgi:hypothetical protein
MLNGLKNVVLTLAACSSVCSFANYGKSVLDLELSGLGSMKGQHFEGWNIVDGEPKSTGRFAISKSGKIFQVNAAGKALKLIGYNGKASFLIDQKTAKGNVFVLTIEPNGDQDEKPSQVHILGGKYDHKSADLSIAHETSINTDFTSADGTFILAAPTGGTPNQGMWFVIPGEGKPSLSLPELPEGWAYEGWVVNTKNEAVLSTGIFRDFTIADSDNAGIFAGASKLNFPPLPGQDIVQTPVLLDDGIHSVVVTVEPYPDYDPAPSAIKILKGDIQAGAPGMTSLPLNNIADGVPSGKASIR